MEIYTVYTARVIIIMSLIRHVGTKRERRVSAFFYVSATGNKKPNPTVISNSPYWTTISYENNDRVDRGE